MERKSGLQIIPAFTKVLEGEKQVYRRASVDEDSGLAGVAATAAVRDLPAVPVGFAEMLRQAKNLENRTRDVE